MSSASKRKIVRALIGGGILFSLATVWHLIVANPAVEAQSVAWRYQNANRLTQASDKVVVIDIDEQSFKNLSSAYGSWPWPRRIYKDLIEFLSAGEPAAILFDITFTERRGDGHDDAMLAQASKNAGNVSHAFTFLKEPSETGISTNPLPAGFREKFALKLGSIPFTFTFRLPVFRDYEVPPPPFFRQIPRFHSVTIQQASNGTFEAAPLLFNYDGDWYPSLTLVGIMAAVKDPRVEVTHQHVVVHSTGRGPIRLPYDDAGSMPLHYYGLDRAPQSIPIDSVLASAAQMQSGKIHDPAELQVNPLEFKGKVILIGASASGLQDLKATPLHPNYPGALLQATAVSNGLLNDHLTRLPMVANALVLLFGLMLIYAVVFSQPGIIGRIGVPFLAYFAYLSTSIFLFQHLSICLEMARPSVAWLIALFDAFSYLFIIETAERRKLRDTLSKYLSPVVTEKLMTSGIDPRAEIGAQKELSILFSDIRGFTSISEQLPAEKIVECLNGYLSSMNEIVFTHLGTVDKFIGDGLMAFWGAPLEDDFHAVRAVRCGLDMIDAMQGLRDRLRRDFGMTHELTIGIGVNSGKVIVGNIGSERHLSYTVIGDNVNLASRVESITKQYSVPFLIGETTYEAVKHAILCRLVDDVQVKGKSQHVRVYQPLADRNHPDAERFHRLAGPFGNAWKIYAAGEFATAERLFENIETEFPGDGPSRIYRERCRNLITNPPENWSVVHVLKSK